MELLGWLNAGSLVPQNAATATAAAEEEEEEEPKLTNFVCRRR